MPTLNQSETEVEVDAVPDRREVIETAFEAAEAIESGTDTKADPVEPKQAPVEEPGDAGAITEPVDQPGDKAPQSWKAPQKAKWSTLDPDVRQEVTRRERETSKVLSESANARQFAHSFHQAIQPFQARLQATGVNPIVAVQELLRADYTLSTAPKVQRAQYMAKLIKDYDIDIMELDSALAGSEPNDPVESRVQQLLQQQLAPFQQYLQQQQRLQQQQETHTAQQVSQTIEQMAANPQYPHFEALRDDMADLIDVASKRGVYLTLEDAYNRATAMNPQVSKLVASQQATTAKQISAQNANARAQKALNASVSVGGAPSATPSGSMNGTDRRAAIEAAFESLSGR